MRSLLYLFFLLTGLAVIHPLHAQNGKVKTLSAKKFERKMQRPDVVVLDVRTEEEFVAGHIKDALLLDVKKDDFSQKIQTLDKQKTYLLYCRSSKRSEKALQMMNAAGFDKAYHLKGGYLHWQQKKK